MRLLAFITPLTKVKALQLFQVLRQGSVILTGVFLAKSVLTTTDIGVYELLLYIGTLMSFFWVNGLLQGMLPLYPNLNNEEQRSFLFNAYLLFVGIALSVFALLYFGKSFLLPFLTGQGDLPFYALYCLFLLINLPTYVVEYFYLLNDKPKLILSFGIVAFGLQFCAILVPVFLGWGLLWSFYSLIGVAIIKHIWTLFIVFNDGKIVYNFSLIKQYLQLAAPLILYAFIGGFAFLFDKWLVGWYYQDESAFAIFTYGARELPLALALANAFSAAMIPEVAKNLKTALVQIKEKSRKLYHILFPISIALMLTSSLLFPIVFNVNFLESAMIFNVYLLVLVSRLLFPQTVLIGLQETKVMLYISIIELFLNIALSFLLVYSMGLVGIALATVIAYLFEKIAITIYLKRKFDITLSQYTDLPLFSLYSVLLFGSFGISWYFF